MRPIPLPVRVAAGLVATAVEQARRFPAQLLELPVTAASRAVQAGMRMQQRVTELAIKGDEIFAIFQRTGDTAPWARFDEDERAGSGAAAPEEVREIRSETNGGPVGAPGSDGARTSAAVPGPAGRHQDTHDIPDIPDIAEVGEVDESDVAQALSPSPPSPQHRPPDRSAATLPIPEYDTLTLPQLRGKLRGLSLAELEALLDHEHTHQERAPFITMLANRISTVRSR